VKGEAGERICTSVGLQEGGVGWGGRYAKLLPCTPACSPPGMLVVAFFVSNSFLSLLYQITFSVCLLRL
jgi:hypothetical protein